ncbi:type VII secretion protein EccB [Jatrophihabitans endophyticus]|uniref:Type VII secretion protein EccB n=1 Tax=Jatrophihabitans endophyticus TaxID=1206085 RepID=A0A1M5HA18_9ACTN|nr:type VII secretion protein EccB [Jatrophihabitans endophyticus]SHG12728.1 type VII secretion protein EccB [Jatrophihabitans endophyticus]
MASARDQVEAYGFAARRQVLALLRGDDESTVDPRRRLSRSVVGGVLLAIALLAGAGVAGFLSGGASDSVPRAGVIVDEDTGGAYVLTSGVLHPALNIASAHLVAGKQTTTIAGSALARLPRGLPVGIPDAPDQLPPAGALDRGAWTVCSTAPRAEAERARVVVSLGARVPTPLPAGSGVPVRSSDGVLWLLEDGVRYRVDAAASTLLGLDRVAPVAVGADVLDLVPEGPRLAVPTVRGAGATPTVTLPFAAKVGDVVEADNGTAQPARYVVLSDGVAPVDQLAFALLAGGADRTLRVQASQVVSVASTSRPDLPDGWPRTFALARPPVSAAPLCVSYRPGAAASGAAWPVTVSEPATVPLPAGARASAPRSGRLPTAATGVAVPPGSGALVKAVGAGGVDGVYALVTDSGLRFPIAGADAAGRLGYDVAAAQRVPLPFVRLLPSGPALDPAAAAAEYSGSR